MSVALFWLNVSKFSIQSVLRNPENEDGLTIPLNTAHLSGPSMMTAIRQRETTASAIPVGLKCETR
jgi:hypothetical protein